MAKASKLSNYVLLPSSGLIADEVQEVSDFFSTLSAHAMSVEPLSLDRRSTKAKKSKLDLTVLDSIHENGAKLVQVDEENLAELRLSYPGMRIVPEVRYQPAWVPQFVLENSAGRPSGSGSGQTISIEVMDTNGSFVQGARVVLVTSVERREGVDGRTNARGSVNLSLPGRTRVERLYVYPEHSSWPLRLISPKFVNKALKITISAIDLAFTDSMFHFLRQRSLSLLAGEVMVAVVDTGVDDHVDLPGVTGMNLVRNQPSADFRDVRGHGTHVAGIIGGLGTPPRGMRGIAAGAQIRSYRVFPGGRTGATNFDIMKAIDQAVMDGCDLVNLSLGGARQDPGVSSAIASAYHRGVVCFAATGNDGRAPVAYPAAAQFSIAVSAMGRKDTWPKNSVQADMVKSPFSIQDKKNFIASFSNVGPEVDITGPGVGVISTYLNNKYAVLDGTSMACPAATGAAARLLAGDSNVLQADRNASRSNAMMKLFSTHVKSMGFSATLEGKGLLKP